MTEDATRAPVWTVSLNKADGTHVFGWKGQAGEDGPEEAAKRALRVAWLAATSGKPPFGDPPAGLTASAAKVAPSKLKLRSSHGEHWTLPPAFQTLTITRKLAHGCWTRAAAEAVTRSRAIANPIARASLDWEGSPDHVQWNATAHQDRDGAPIKLHFTGRARDSKRSAARWETARSDADCAAAVLAIALHWFARHGYAGEGVAIAEGAMRAPTSATLAAAWRLQAIASLEQEALAGHDWLRAIGAGDVADGVAQRIAALRRDGREEAHAAAPNDRDGEPT